MDLIFTWHLLSHQNWMFLITAEVIRFIRQTMNSPQKKLTWIMRQHDGFLKFLFVCLILSCFKIYDSFAWNIIKQITTNKGWWQGVGEKWHVSKRVQTFCYRVSTFERSNVLHEAWWLQSMILHWYLVTKWENIWTLNVCKGKPWNKGFL